MEQDSNVNLKWDAHQSTLKSVFDNLLLSESLADCTVGAEGQHLKAHKIILSACSQYFEVLFSQHNGKHTIIILPGVEFCILKALMEFMYRGEVVVRQDRLDALLQLADFLQVKGLSYHGNVVSEKKHSHKRRNKLPTSHCHASSESYKLCNSPELLEVPGSSSQSECLQKQDYVKVAPISSPAHKRKKSDWQPSREEPSHRQDFVPLTHTVSCNFPLQRQEFPDKSSLDHDVFSDPVPGPSVTSQLPVSREGNFSKLPSSTEELITTKPLNSVVRTALCPTSTEDNTILETFADPKQEKFSDLSEDVVCDVIVDSDEAQQQNTSDDNSFDTSKLTEISFCGGESFVQQMQFQQAHWTNTDTTEQTSDSNNRFRCQSCDRSYRYYKGLMRHLKYECGKEPQFQCPHCSVRFTHKYTLKIHMVRHSNFQ